MPRLYPLLSFCLVMLVIPGFAQSQKTTEKKPAEENKPADKKESTPGKVTFGDVTYVVIKSTARDTGKNVEVWTLVIEATSKVGDQSIHIGSARAITADGKNFEVTLAGSRASKPVSLPEGVKIQLELPMGVLPKAFANEKALARLELFGPGNRRGPGIPGIAPPARGERETKPLVLENVPIEHVAK